MKVSFELKFIFTVTVVGSFCTEYIELSSPKLMIESLVIIDQPC